MKFKQFINESRKQKHSKEFLQILEQASPNTVIRAITHSKPLLVFWVSPDGTVIDAKDAHFDNPPNGDRSILANSTNKGYLRGRAAEIGNVVYIVIYGDKNSELSNSQKSLLRRSYSRILSTLRERDVDEEKVNSAQFIQEDGQDILI